MKFLKVRFLNENDYFSQRLYYLPEGTEITKLTDTVLSDSNGTMFPVSGKICSMDTFNMNDYVVKDKNGSTTLDISKGLIKLECTDTCLPLISIRKVLVEGCSVILVEGKDSYAKSHEIAVADIPSNCREEVLYSLLDCVTSLTGDSLVDKLYELQIAQLDSGSLEFTVRTKLGGAVAIHLFEKYIFFPLNKKRFDVNKINIRLNRDANVLEILHGDSIELTLNTKYFDNSELTSLLMRFSVLTGKRVLE